MTTTKPKHDYFALVDALVYGPATKAKTRSIAYHHIGASLYFFIAYAKTLTCLTKRMGSDCLPGSEGPVAFRQMQI